MVAVFEALSTSPDVERMAQALIHSLWQGVAVAAGLTVLLWLGRSLGPNQRYALTLLALMGCLALPILTFTHLRSASHPRGSLSSRLVSAEAAHHAKLRTPSQTRAEPLQAAPATLTARPKFVPPTPLRWKFKPKSSWIVLVWFLGVVILSTHLGVDMLMLQRLRSSFTRRAPEPIAHTVRRLRGRLGLSQGVEVKLSRVADVPLVLGYLKPLILVPTSALSGLTPEQLELILAHELAHIKRRDPFVNLLQRVAETLLFFNPAVWWISNQVRQEREYCCDVMAMATCNSSAYAYAQTLNRLSQLRIQAQIQSQPSNPLGLAANGGSLLKRILTLMGKPSTPDPSHALAGVSLALVSLVIASVALAQPRGGVLTVPFESMPQLDPYKSAGSGELNAFSQLFDPLVMPDLDDYSATPYLAESWENPDDTTWIFTLRRGVTFHDGNEVFEEGANREVVADDVVYSINRFLEVSTVFTLGDIESVTALDDYTVELKTAQPDPFLLSDPNRLARVLIVPQEAIEQLGEDGFALNPIGSGPFELESFTPDQELNLVRNEDYFVEPNLDGVEFVFIPDPTVQTISLEAEDIDVVPYLFNIDSVLQLADNPDVTLLPGPGSYRGLGINVTTPPFDELAVRDAISKAIDIDGAVASVISEYGQRAYGQVPYWFEFEEDPELPGLWSYDPDAALAQLEEVGFSDSDGDGVLDRDGEPLSFDIKTIAGSQTRVLTILVTQLQQLGINANLLLQDGAVWGEDLQQGNDTSVFFDYSFASLTGLYALFHGDNIGTTNTHFYDSDEVDALLDEASATLDFETRNDLWLEAQRLIMADRAAIPLYFENGYAVVNNNVKDLRPGALGLQLVSLQNNAYLEE